MRDSHVHEVARAEPDRPRHPRQLRCGRSGLDALNPSDKPAEKVATFGADTPLRRPAQPEEIAPAYLFFASNADSSDITGEILTLPGGETTAA